MLLMRLGVAEATRWRRPYDAAVMVGIEEFGYEWEDEGVADEVDRRLERVFTLFMECFS